MPNNGQSMQTVPTPTWPAQKCGPAHTLSAARRCGTQVSTRKPLHPQFYRLQWASASLCQHASTFATAPLPLWANKRDLSGSAICLSPPPTRERSGTHSAADMLPPMARCSPLSPDADGCEALRRPVLHCPSSCATRICTGIHALSATWRKYHAKDRNLCAH